jgi:hypothetical protein
MPSRPNPFAILILTALLVGSACLTDEGSVLRPETFRKFATTDGQVVVAGGRTTSPMKVSVLAEDGSGVVRVAILWSVVSGPMGSSLSDSLTLTDGFGTAQASLLLGPDEGEYIVRAALEADETKAVTFTVTALEAPQVTTINPATFSGGDTVTLSGANLTQTTSFTVGGRLADVIGISMLGFDARLVIPTCLPDDSVDVRAVLMGVNSQPVFGRHVPTTSTLNLAQGEYVSVGSAEVGGCARLPAPGPGGAEYLVAVQSVGANAEGNFGYALTNGGPVTSSPPGENESLSFAEEFHRGLRFEERTMSETRSETGAKGKTSIPAAPVIEGQTREFVVCETFPCRSVGDFTDIRAEAVFVGERAAIYVDENTPANGLSSADFDALGATFDEQLYEVDTRAFGAESDVDENGRVVILMTPAVNGLTEKAECAESFITGFFLAVDIDPFFARDPRSNQGEVFYSFVADPSGTVSCDHSLDRVRRGVPVTFVHEFQHMINYYQHVVLRGGESEILWLNEALSHLAEELAGHQFRALGDNTNFTRFVIGDLLNAYNYLKDPGAVSVLASEGSGTLAERGAGWLFVRWLVDTHGDDVARRLSESSRSGVANVENAVQRPIGSLLTEWFLANWVSGLLPDSLVPPRLQYRTWTFRSTYQSLHEQVPSTFDIPFPIVPDTLSASAPFNVFGSVAAGSGEYYVVIQQAGDPGLSFSLTADGTRPLSHAGDPRLTILRTR